MKKLSLNKKTPILIVGLGSAGRRHYGNLLKLGYKNVWVYDIDKRKIEDFRLQILDLNAGTLKDFEIIFICSPNHLHVKHAILAAAAGCHIFIEKPLSHNLNGIFRLERLIKSKKLINMVACNMRFHPALQFVKNYVAKKDLGKIYRIELEFGYYLPYWRKGTDYRKNYAARRSTGGGIILDDIHEFDLLFWLNDFAQVKKKNILFGKVGDLAIETEDMSNAIFEFENSVFGLVKSDYLQKAYARRLKIVGEKGNLEWDYQKNIVWFANEKGRRKLFDVKRYDSNQMYLKEIEYFLNSVAKKKKTFNDIETASKILKILLLGRAREI